MLQRFESFVMGVTSCYKYIQRIKTMEMEEYDLKGTHMMCLYFLHHHSDGLTAAELCRLCAEDKAAISRALATLREREYVFSVGKTYRALWHLSEKGLEIAVRVDDLIEQWVALGGSGLSEEDRAAFYKTLAVIGDNLRDTLEQ